MTLTSRFPDAKQTRVARLKTSGAKSGALKSWPVPFTLRLPDGYKKQANTLFNTMQTTIQDFGEKIHGAKKDLWRQYADTMAAGLPDDVAQITLATHFPLPDFDKAIENGACPDNLATIKALRDLIPAKPRKSYKLARWGELVKTLHAMAQAVAAGEFKVPLARLDELLANAGWEIASKVKFYRKLGYPLFMVADGWGISHGNALNLDHTWKPVCYASKRGVYGDLPRSDLPDCVAAESAVFELLKTRLAGELEKPSEARKTTFALYSNRVTSEIFIGKKCARGVVHVKDGFKVASEARAFLADHRPDLESIWEEKSKEPMLRKAANEPRVGIARRVGNVSPEMFSAAFGFRGV